MNVQVVVERVPGSGYVARAGSPYDMSAEGATEEEALAKLKQRAAAAKVITLDLPNGANPWVAICGDSRHLVGDPMWEEYKQAVEDYRNRVDQDEDRP